MQNNVIEYLEKTAARFPDKIAIEDEFSTVTFSELLDTAKSISGYLIEFGVKRNQPIAVLLPKSIKAVESFLGILYAGCFYVPIDISNPHDRIKSIFEKIEPNYIISENDICGDVISSSANKNIALIDYSRAILCKNKRNVFLDMIDTDPAYIISTSGSTGTPKGVVVTHRSIIDYIDWAVSVYDVKDTNVIGSQAPFVFDNSVLDIYLMLSTGAKLFLIPDNKFIFPSKLIDYIQEKEINFLFWVPSIMSNVMKTNALEGRGSINLTHILFAGEVMPSKVYMYWKKHIPKALYSNLYGPTEITVDCTYLILNADYSDEEEIPIGHPCKNTNILIIGEDNSAITKPNELGELCVRGSSLAAGYYNDWKKTAESFIQNPLNPHYPELIYRTGDLVCYNELGELMYKGRKDSQIKHMGYRIELGEIETAALAIDGVDKACVLYESQEKNIILIYESSVALTKKDILIGLHGKLPKYMMPSRFTILDEMPLNSNGKIDRSMLKEICIDV